jgi:hypothetical protein
MINSCEICGTTDKKPTAKYCSECSKMIHDEHKILIQEIWKKAVEITKLKRGKNII